MAWQDHLTDKERSELHRAESKRDAAKTEFNAIRIRLKARADARIRNGRDAEARERAKKGD